MPKRGSYRPGTLALAADNARQVNVLGDNYAPVIFGSAAAPTRSLHQLPPKTKDFSGRSEDIRAVEDEAGDDGAGPHIVNIYGTPGVGKSALAVYVAHRLANRFDEIQLYADLGEQNGEVPTAAQILQRFVADLDPATISVPVGAAGLLQRYRSLLAQRRCLILLDNAQSADQVEELVPASTTSAVLVTSRVPLSAIDGVSLCHLDLMSEDESLALLTDVSQRHLRSAEDEKTARTLVRQCGRLPLALRIAGAILKKKGHWTLTKLVNLFTDERTRLANLVAGSLDVRSSFEISYHDLNTTEAHAFRVLSLLPLSRFQAHHAGVFLQVPEAQAEQLLEGLVDAQLIETDDGTHFRYHDLLRLYARQRCASAGDDPDGIRMARFMEIYTSNFLKSYQARLLNSQWSTAGPAPLPRLPRRQRRRGISRPDGLYIPQRLTQAEPNLFGALHVPWQEVLAEHSKVLILGGAGAGKTILADRICYEVAAGLAADRLDVAFTASLRQLNRRAQRLERLVTDSIRLRHDLEMPYETLEILLNERRTLIIFDGLDELPISERDRTQAGIAKFCKAYPRAQILVLSRPGSSTSDLISSGFVAHVIDGFSASDIRAYFARWAEATHMNPSEAEMLLAEVTLRRETASWLSNPLLAAQVALVSTRTGHFPSRVIDLYDATYNLLFNGREVYRGISRSTFLRPEELGKLVCYLAYKFVTQLGGALEMSSNDFWEVLQEAPSLNHPRWRSRAYELESLLSASDLPVRPTPSTHPQRNPRWTLVRDPFGQYLAARYIVEQDDESVGERVMTAIRASGFIEGARYVRYLLEDRHSYAAIELTTALRAELNRESDPETHRSLQHIVSSF